MASAGRPKSKAEPITKVVCLQFFPEKPDQPEEPIKKYPQEATPKERKMPKVAEPKKSGFSFFCGWLAKFDCSNYGQSELSTLWKKLELGTAKPRVAGETARLGAVAAL